MSEPIDAAGLLEGTTPAPWPVMSNAAVVNDRRNARLIAAAPDLAAEVIRLRAALEVAQEALRDVHALAMMWEHRVSCLQCGLRYSRRACGPSHALVANMVKADWPDRVADAAVEQEGAER